MQEITAQVFNQKILCYTIFAAVFMKNIFWPVLIIGVALFGGYFLLQNSQVQKQLSPVPSPSTISTTETYCSPQDLQATLTLDAGAGNIYGNATIKNISAKNCQIVGSNFISAQYAQSIQNIVVTHVGQSQTNIFDLSPNQTVYSQVHYPNGPQCGSGIQIAKVKFAYAISTIDTIMFTAQNGDEEQDVTICTSPSELTTIQVWNMSSQPITP